MNKFFAYPTILKNFMERFMHVKMKFMAHIKFLGNNIIKKKNIK